MYRAQSGFQSEMSHKTSFRSLHFKHAFKQLCVSLEKSFDDIIHDSTILVRHALLTVKLEAADVRSIFFTLITIFQVLK